jgi:16S rRNA (guanine966-N2)-methyltransferase
MSRKNVQKQGKLRIIGGQWRSRILPVIEQPDLRPTPDRVRETLFNWLIADIASSHCLDLFAGSGALGFEAASRGAAEVVMLELQAAAYKVLQANAQTLQADNKNNSTNIKCIQQDALQWLQSCGDKFDVVFLDPPYESDLLTESFRLLEQSGCLAVDAKIYIEHPSQKELPVLPENWQIIRGKKAGQVGYYLATNKSQETE